MLKLTRTLPLLLLLYSVAVRPMADASPNQEAKPTWSISIASPEEVSRKQQNPDDCVICLETTKQTNENPNPAAMGLRCQHTVHASCIAPWLRKKLECPSCRTTVAGILDNGNVLGAEEQPGPAVSLQDFFHHLVVEFQLTNDEVAQIIGSNIGLSIDNHGLIRWGLSEPARLRVIGEAQAIRDYRQMMFNKTKNRNLIIIGTLAAVAYGWPLMVLGCKKLFALRKKQPVVQQGDAK